MRQNKKSPKMRFPEFHEEWKTKKIGSLLSRHLDEVKVRIDEEYTQIGIRSHGKGIFHKEPLMGVELGRKRVFWVKPNLFILNIVFAWEQAVAVTTNSEAGLIASHRFPMFLPINNLLDVSFLKNFFLRKEGKELLGLASPGGAGRNKTLGQAEFMKLQISVPEIREQTKIDNAIESLDKKIQNLQEQQKLLMEFKRGAIQKIFAMKIRFTDKNKCSYPSWQETELNEVLFEHNLKSTGREKVFSVSVSKGLVNQIEHLGRSYSAKDTRNYKLVKQFDLVYTKSPTGGFPFGIVKQNKVKQDVIVSPLYGVFSPESSSLGSIIEAYFSFSENIYNYLAPIVQKGAKNTINITNKVFLSKTLQLPRHHEEQQKIADFLMAIDTKIDAVAAQIEQTIAFKKGLLQQMFV